MEETRNYFDEKIQQNRLMSKKHKKVCTTLNYIVKKQNYKNCRIIKNYKKLQNFEKQKIKQKQIRKEKQNQK